MDCAECGRDLAGLPYTCKRCGERFCAEHRLPEEHDCEVLQVEQAERALKREAGETEPWFDDTDTDRAARVAADQPAATSTDRGAERRRALGWMLAILVAGAVLAVVVAARL